MKPSNLCAFPRITRWDAAGLFVILAVVLLLNASIFFFSHIPLDEDSLLFFYPLRSLHSDSDLGFWNPYQFCGFPRDANTQSQILYPPNLITWFCSPARAYSLLLVVHLFLGGGLFYVLLRCFRLTETASLFGALAFSVSTFWRCKITNLGMLEGIAWVPAILLFFLFALEYRHWIYAVVSALFFALMIFAGVPHTVVYTTIFLLILVVFYSFANPKFTVRYFGYLLWTLVGALFLTLFIWLPALLYAPQTGRLQLKLNEALVGALGWNEIWRTFLGGLSQPEISRCDPWESTCYFGVTALFFVPMGWKAIPGRLRYGLTAAFLFSVLCTLGKNGGLFVWLYNVVPGWSFLNLPNRSLLIAAMILPIFAAFGLERIFQNAKPSIQKVIALAVVSGIGVVIVGIVLIQNSWAWTSLIYTALTTTFQPESLTPVQWSGFHFVFWLAITGLVMIPLYIKGSQSSLVVVLLSLLIVAQSIQYSQRLFLQTTSPDYFEPPKVVELLKERMSEEPGRVCAYTPYIDNPSDVRINNIQSTLAHRLPEVFRVYGIQGYDPFYPKRYAELIRAWAGQNEAVDPVRKLRVANLPQHMLDFLGVRYVVGFPSQENHFRGGFEIRQPDSAHSPFDEPKTISSFSVRWLTAGGLFVQQGEEVGSVHLLANDERIESYPIRMGIEIANSILRINHQRARHRAANIYRWFPFPTYGGYMNVQQYRTVFPVDSPGQVDAIAFEWNTPNATLGIRQIDYRTPNETGLRLISDENELPLYENPDAFGPVYLSRHVLRYSQVDEIVKSFENLQPDQDIPVFLSQEQEHVFDTSLIAGTRDEQSSISVTRPHSDEMIIDVESQFDCLLVIQENYSPNWQAKIGRETVSLLRANHTFMALPISKGEHQITLTYIPRFFYVVSSISGATLIVFLIFIFMHYNTFRMACEKAEPLVVTE